MALICKKILNIKDIYTNKLKEILNTPVILNQRSSIIDKISFKTTFNLINILNEMEMNNHNLYHRLEENLAKKLELNCNNSDVYDSFKFLVETRTTNTIISKYLRHFNLFPDYFKKQQLEEITKIINSETLKSMVTPDIIDELLVKHNSSLKNKKVNFNIKKPKAIIRNEIIEKCLKLNKFSFNYIRYDPENVCLQIGNEKPNKNLNDDEDSDLNKFQNLITFCELDDIQSNDLLYFQSLINSINPNIVMINNEPFTTINSSNIEKMKPFLEENKAFKDKQEFIDLLDKLGNYKYRNLESTVYYKSSGYLAIVESIIFYCSAKKIKSELFDCSINDFLYSYSKYLESNNGESNIAEIEIESMANLTNILAILHWIKIQENSGCSKCANFFNKKALKIQPTPLEFMFDKKLLPNYENTNAYRIKSIYDAFRSNQNVLVFTNDIFSDTKDFVEYFNLDNTEKSKFNEKIKNGILDFKLNKNNNSINKRDFYPLKFKSNLDRFHYKKINNDSYCSILFDKIANEEEAININNILKINEANNFAIDKSILDIVENKESKCGIDNFFKEKLI